MQRKEQFQTIPETIQTTNRTENNGTENIHIPAEDLHIDVNMIQISFSEFIIVQKDANYTNCFFRTQSTFLRAQQKVMTLVKVKVVKMRMRFLMWATF